MKSNLTKPEPELGNAQAVAILKEDGAYLIQAPGSPGTKMFEVVTGHAPYALVIVQDGKMYGVRIAGELDPATLPAALTFKGPLTP